MLTSMQGVRGNACNSHHDVPPSMSDQLSLSHPTLLSPSKEEWDEDEISETSMEDSDGAANFTTSKRQLLVSRTHKARLQEAETQGHTIPEVGHSHHLFQTLALLSIRARDARAQCHGPVGLQHLERIGHLIVSKVSNVSKNLNQVQNSEHTTPSPALLSAMSKSRSAGNAQPCHQIVCKATHTSLGEAWSSAFFLTRCSQCHQDHSACESVMYERTTPGGDERYRQV